VLDRPVAGFLIGKDDLVGAAVVLEEEGDAIVLGQARDKGEVGLAVLHHEVALWIGAHQAELGVLVQAHELELLHDDLGHREVEVDLLHLDQREAVSAGLDPQAKGLELGLGVEPVGRLYDHPVEPSELSGFVADALDKDDARVDAEHRVEGELAGLGADYFKLEPEELRDSLAAVEPYDLHVVAGKLGRLEPHFDVIVGLHASLGDVSLWRASRREGRRGL
jgi:hypothetical protein